MKGIRLAAKYNAESGVRNAGLLHDAVVVYSVWANPLFPNKKKPVRAFFFCVKLKTQLCSAFSRMILSSRCGLVSRRNSPTATTKVIPQDSG